MDPILPTYSTSPAVGGGEPAGGGVPVPVGAGQPAGDAPAVGVGPTSENTNTERAPNSTPHQVHQGVGGGSAVGGAPPVGWVPPVAPVAAVPGPVVIPAWDPEYSKNDVADFRKYQEWRDLISWVTESSQAPFRRMLSAHTNFACQACQSKKGPNVWTFLPAGRLHAKLPHAFVYGDGLGVRYLSEGSGLLTR